MPALRAARAAIVPASVGLRPPAGGFARCHKSYLVNLEWVESVARAGVLLRDGRRLPVSRSHYIAFQSALIRYLNQRKG